MPITGQLTDGYDIPKYAQDMLYVVSHIGVTAQTQGKKGLFNPGFIPGDALYLAWARGDGPILAYWEYPPKPEHMDTEPGVNIEKLSLRWDGQVKVGGYIERLHALEAGGLEVIIMEVRGGPFMEDYGSLPSLTDMHKGIYARPAEPQLVREDLTYHFIILAESHYAALAQDALVAKIAVDVSGALADDNGQWHEIIGLPLIIQSLTLVAP